MQETPLGRRHHLADLRGRRTARLPLGIHAGSNYRNPVTSLGWPSHYVEDYTSQAQGFQSQVDEPDHRGRVRQISELKVALLESGVTWLPGFLWRFSKFWRGARTEVPWVDRSPAGRAR